MSATTLMSTATPGMHALTEAQNGLWYAQRLDPDNPIFNTGHVIEIDGPLDMPALQEAAQRALACLLYTSPSPRDKRQSRMPSSA